MLQCTLFEGISATGYLSLTEGGQRFSAGGMSFGGILTGKIALVVAANKVWTGVASDVNNGVSQRFPYSFKPDPLTCGCLMTGEFQGDLNWHRQCENLRYLAR